jgi:hypothetical protein
MMQTVLLKTFTSHSRKKNNHFFEAYLIKLFHQQKKVLEEYERLEWVLQKVNIILQKQLCDEVQVL